MRRFVVAVGLGLHLGIFIACLVLGSFFLGLWLDRRLGTAPCLIIVFVMIGFVLAVIGAYRLATRLSE
jgi:F0F1-type ATP synthase assembly protein I